MILIHFYIFCQKYNYKISPQSNILKFSSFNHHCFKFLNTNKSKLNINFFFRLKIYLIKLKLLNQNKKKV